MIFVAMMAVTDLAITGCAMLPASERSAGIQLRRQVRSDRRSDWITRVVRNPDPPGLAGFIRPRCTIQTIGGAELSLRRDRRDRWRYYYLVASAVKVPLLFWLVMAAGAAWPGASHFGETGLDLAGDGRAFSWRSPHWIEAQFRLSLSAAGRTAGDRLDLGPGERRAWPRRLARSAWPARRWRSR